MKRNVAALLFAGAFVVAGGAAWAHHSFAMFDQEHPVDMVGVVHEFKFTSPHTFILLKVKGTDGTEQIWNLEGGAPSGLVRDGWNSKTLKPGDELAVKVDPLRSGAPGARWMRGKAKSRKGRPTWP